MMADQPSQAKKLYIETVGCQMNLLDSELVVANLRKDGYELTDDLSQADLVLYNTCSVRQHAEDKIYSALGRIKRLKERKPGASIGVLGCMAQKDQDQIFRRAPHVDLVVGPGQLARVGELVEKSKQENDAADGRQPGAVVGLARGDHGELRGLRPGSRAGPPAHAVSGVRPRDDGLRQVLHVLHRSVGSGAGAEPSTRGDPGRGPRAGGAGSQGDHAAGPDCQQLQVPSWRRPDRPSLGPARGAARCRRDRADQVHHQLPERHDG